MNRTVHMQFAPCAIGKMTKIQLEDPYYEGGANTVSLKQAQENFAKYGASESIFIENVRSPLPEEARDESWKPIG